VRNFGKEDIKAMSAKRNIKFYESQVQAHQAVSQKRDL
jgi:hypothetical protein